MNLLEVRKMCEDKMLELGAGSFWYWDVGVFVFAGDETTVSVSGTQYVTSDRLIARNDIIRIDLSPQNEDTWGDFARTLIVQNGTVVDQEQVANVEWRAGLEMEDFLHEELFRFATPQTTFEELYYHMNRVIEEKGNKSLLGEVKYFTFEPHISVPGSKFGYKKENIYYFENENLMEL